VRSIIFIVCILFLILGCEDQPNPTVDPNNTDMTSSSPIQDVNFLTEDSVLIHATLYNGSGKGVLILVHQLNKDRSTWDAFARYAQEKGYSSLAIDMRGHGENKGSWKSFSNADFANIVLDIKAAKQFLSDNGYPTDHLVIIGASIGANAALRYASEDPDVLGLFLLSPGLEYRGVKTHDAIVQYGTRFVEIAVSDGDTYSAQSAEQLDDLAKNPKLQIRSFEGNAHGTDMLNDLYMETLVLELNALTQQ